MRDLVWSLTGDDEMLVESRLTAELVDTVAVSLCYCSSHDFRQVVSASILANMTAMAVNEGNWQENICKRSKLTAVLNGRKFTNELFAQFLTTNRRSDQLGDSGILLTFSTAFGSSVQ